MNKTRKGARWQPTTIYLFVCMAFLCVIALTGGSARADIQSLIVLRPLAVLFFAAGVVSLDPAALRNARGLFLLTGLTLLLIGLHIVPLPPAIWHALPQGDILSRIDKVTGADPSWRPLTLDPYLGSNALWAWFVPAAALVWVSRVPADRQDRLLTLAVVIGAASAAIGLLQLFGGRDSVFYTYRITNRLSMVGLFANRNHEALLLAIMFPVVAAWVRLASAEALRFRQVAGLAFAMILPPALLATGSRAGLVLGLLGAASVPFVAPGLFRPLVDRMERYEVRTRRQIYFGAIAAILVFLALSVFAIGLSAGASLDRLLAGDAADDLRGPFWVVGWEMVKAYFPLGSGFGSFVLTFQMFEPHELLDVKYANHAHNDWLEILIEAGLPGGLLALGWAGWVASRLLGAARPGTLTRERVMARAGGIAIILAILASFPDYPLRTPLMASLAIMFAYWLTLPRQAVTELHSVHRPVRNAKGSRRNR